MSKRKMYYCDECKLGFRPEVILERYGVKYHNASRFSRALGAFGHPVRAIGSDSEATLDTSTPDAVVSDSRLLDKSGRVDSAGEGSSVQLEPSLLSLPIEYEYSYSMDGSIIFSDKKECSELADGMPIFRREVRRGPWEML